MMTRYKVDDWEYPIIGLVLFRYISDTFIDYSVLWGSGIKTPFGQERQVLNFVIL